MKKLVVTGMIVASLGLTSGAIAGSACCPMSSDKTEKKADSTAKAIEKKADGIAKEVTKKADEVASVEAE